jgi:hypothetical protein
VRKGAVAAARIAAGLWLAFVAILAALHVLEPEFNAGGHLISGYELGNYGWLMSLAFFCLGGASFSASFSLCYAIKNDLLIMGGRVGTWWCSSSPSRTSVPDSSTRTNRPAHRDEGKSPSCMSRSFFLPFARSSA